jgi:hypothetical protein
MPWCNKCCENNLEREFDTIKKVKGKTGYYYPYRDTLDSEEYTYTEVTLKCKLCGEITIEEEDEVYCRSKTDMEKYGYRGSNY